MNSEQRLAEQLEEPIGGPKKKNLSETLRELDGDRARVEFLMQLKGKRVYHFSEDGQKQYLKLRDDRIRKGQDYLTFEVYDLDGNPVLDERGKQKEEKSMIERTEYRGWKKGGSVQGQYAMFRDDNGEFSQRAAEEIIADDYVVYENEGKVAYARPTPPRPDPKENEDTAPFGPPDKDELEGEMELGQESEIGDHGSFRAVADSELEGKIEEKSASEGDKILEEIEKEFRDTGRRIADLNVDQDIKHYLFTGESSTGYRNPINLERINRDVKEVLWRKKKGLEGWEIIQNIVREDLHKLNERIDRVNQNFSRNIKPENTREQVGGEIEENEELTDTKITNRTLSEKEKNLYINVQQESVASEKHPDRNEDSIFCDIEKKAFGVFDGMGGHAEGKVASNLSKEYVSEELRELPENFSPEEIRKALERILQEASKEILWEGIANVEQRNMGTTASVVKVWEGKNGEKKAIIGNVGDSRVYILRADGILEQITLDDNIIREKAKDEKSAREIQDKLNNFINYEDLNDLEQRLFNDRNVIYQSLGQKKGISPRMHMVDVKDGDMIIITSDGVHDNLSDHEIRHVINWALYYKKDVAKELIFSSQNRSHDKRHPRAKLDDMSVIVLGFSGFGSTKDQSAPQPEVAKNESEKPQGTTEKSINESEQQSAREILPLFLTVLRPYVYRIEDIKSFEDLVNAMGDYMGDEKNQDSDEHKIIIQNFLNQMERVGQLEAEEIERDFNEELIKLNKERRKKKPRDLSEESQNMVDNEGKKRKKPRRPRDDKY